MADHRDVVLLMHGAICRRAERSHLGYYTEQKRARAYMGLLPDTQNCGLRMRRECRERFPHLPTSKETAS